MRTALGDVRAWRERDHDRLRDDTLMHSVYLSSQAPRWQLSSEENLQTALDRGLIAESHYLDAKRQLPTTSGGNRELARDLASFAVDGGTLIVGLAEDKAAGTLTLVAQPLAGAEEHVEQVARDIPDPPVAVLTRRIPAAGSQPPGYSVLHSGHVGSFAGYGSSSVRGCAVALTSTGRLSNPTRFSKTVGRW